MGKWTVCLPAVPVADAASNPAHSSPRLGAPLWKFTSQHRASIPKTLKLTQQSFGMERYVTNLRKIFSAAEMFSEACLYILKAGYTPFLNTFFDGASKAHIVLRSSNKQLLITNQLTLLFRKSDLESLTDTVTSLPSFFSDTNIGGISSQSELQQKSGAKSTESK